MNNLYDIYHTTILYYIIEERAQDDLYTSSTYSNIHGSKLLKKHVPHYSPRLDEVLQGRVRKHFDKFNSRNIKTGTISSL